ncbi:MAG: CPBP family intramembrane metalloprotease, partial [Propionibacteriaceae bacterium]|nr:CPBP family intramembrane metalloprotease [Propionibacteriaceae bacterium]
MGLYEWIHDPAAEIRASDLLPDDQPPKPWPPVRRWRFNAGLRALVFFGVFVAVTLVAGVVMGAVVGAGDGVDGDPGGGVDGLLARVPWTAIMAVELVAAVVAYAVLAWGMEGRRRPVELAWPRAVDALKGAAVGFLAISLAVGVLALLGSYRIEGFNSGYSPWADLFGAGLVAAVAEEIMFRGVMFRLLEGTFGSAWAIVADCLVFGLVHVGNSGGTLLGGIGVAVESLAVPALYLATRSLWWAMGLHFAWNVAQGPIWGSVVSGSGAASSMVTARWTGPEWLTGGAFGIEASVVTMALFGGFGAWLLWRARKQGLFVL